MTRTPSTAAGRALTRGYPDDLTSPPPEDILAIEDEARADLRALVERLATMTGQGFPSALAAMDAYDDLSNEATRLLALLPGDTAPEPPLDPPEWHVGLCPECPHQRERATPTSETPREDGYGGITNYPTPGDNEPYPDRADIIRAYRMGRKDASAPPREGCSCDEPNFRDNRHAPDCPVARDEPGVNDD